MQQGRQLGAALIWAVLTVLVILYRGRGDDTHQTENHAHSIPSRKIWQVTGDDKVQPAMACAQPWITSNPGWSHTLHTDATAAAFAARHYRRGGGGGDKDKDKNKDNDKDNSTDNRLAMALRELRNTGIRADLIRYLLLWAEGGVYADLDTVPLRRVDEWLPWGEYLGRGAGLVVGVEWDERATTAGAGAGASSASARGTEEEASGDRQQQERPKGVLHEVQFCQWTVVAAEPGHPVFRAAIERALDMLAEHRAFWGAGSLAGVVFSEGEVLNITGPAAWTEVLLAHMMRGGGDGPVGIAGLGGLLSGLEGPRLVGDVLVLPVDAFASGMDHSGSTRAGQGVPEGALVRHLFRGSWREGNKRKKMLC